MKSHKERIEEMGGIPATMITVRITISDGAERGDIFGEIMLKDCIGIVLDADPEVEDRDELMELAVEKLKGFISQDIDAAVKR